MKTLTSLILCSAVVLMPTLHTSSAQAQAAPWQIEARVGAALPAGDLGPLELDTGLDLSGTVAYYLSPQLALYGGWGWHHFESEPNGPGNGPDVEQTGYVLGLRIENDLPRVGLGYRVHGGLTYEHIELENNAGNIVDDSGHDVGFEVGAALLVDLTKNLSLTPGVRYRILSDDIDVGGNRQSVDLEYTALDIGLAWSFW